MAYPLIGMDMNSDIDISELWCWNEDCPDYGTKGKGNIFLKERKGPHQRALFMCRTCHRCFSETHGTPFFGLKTPIDEVARTLLFIPERGSIRAVGRLTGHKADTIINWIKLAGAHAKEVNDYFLQDMNLSQVQVDEIWSFIKKRRKTSNQARKM